MAASGAERRRDRPPYELQLRRDRQGRRIHFEGTGDTLTDQGVEVGSRAMTERDAQEPDAQLE